MDRSQLLVSRHIRHCVGANRSSGDVPSRNKTIIVCGSQHAIVSETKECLLLRKNHFQCMPPAICKALLKW